MSDSKLWLLNSEGKVFTLSPHSRHLQHVTGHGVGREFKRVSALPQSTWALGSDHRLYVYVPSSDIPVRVQEVTYENERWTPGIGWSGRTVIPAARKNWSDVNGQGFLPKENFELPSPNWEWEGEWQVDENMGGEVSGLVGWQYAVNWLSKFSAEQTWKTYVRRRKWVRYRRYTCSDSWAQVATLGDEMGDPAELFLDVSVGGQDLNCQVEGQLCVWTVSITGQVYVRLGVNADCPEGRTWHPISVDLCGGTGVTEVSVGPCGQVWLITWDGQTLVRTDVSCETPYGTDWEQVPGPMGNPLLHVAAGTQAVWALSRDGKIWFWKSQTEGLEGSWIEMVGEMSLLSVSQNDQVLGIGLDDTAVYIRSSITPELLTGKTWEKLSFLEPHRDGLPRKHRSWMSDSTHLCSPVTYHPSHRSQVLSSLHQPHSARPHSISVSTSKFLQQGLVKNKSGDHQPVSLSQSLPNRPLRSHDTKTNSKTTNRKMTGDSVSPNHQTHPKGGTRPKDKTSSKDETNPKDETSSKDDTTLKDETSSKDDTTLKDQTSSKDETVPKDVILQNCSLKTTQIKSEGSVDFDSLTSTSSECVDFVTDLLSPHEKEQIYVTSEEDETCNFVTDLLNSQDDLVECSEPTGPDLESTLTNEETLAHQNCSAEKTEENSGNDLENGDQERLDSNAGESVSDLERSDSISMVTMNWIWVSACALNIADTASLPWLQSNTNIADTEAPPIDQSLRNKLLQELRWRNEMLELFQGYEEAVEKTVWVKRGHLQIRLRCRRGNDWASCELELEQGLRRHNSQSGLLFLHFTQQGKQMHVQLSLADIVCVPRITISNYKAAFAIFLSDAVKSKEKPYILSAVSEKETDDWVATLSMACSSLQGVAQAPDSSICWAVTDRGDVFMHLPTSQPKHMAQRYWQQVGGHMLMVKTNTEGITWAISHDHTAYVYTGGYGGGIFKGISGVNSAVYPQTDTRQMCIYENQKWHLLTGFSSRYLLANKYAWTDETGRKPLTQQSIPTPSSSWQWISDWAVDFSVAGGVDVDGWQYTSFPRTQEFHGQPGWRDSYRRRRWIRRCRLVTSGPWLPVGPLPVIDVSIQPASQSKGAATAIWAVGANGDALCRVGVTPSKPQGEAWFHVPADQPFLAISIGGNSWVWGIARDGSVWFRSGVSTDLPTGKVWLQVVPSPPDGAPLRQVSVGDNSVWAVDSNNNLWRRKNTSAIFPEGTEWELVSRQIRYVSAGQDGQVWVVRDNMVAKRVSEEGVLSRRLGVSTECPLGTGWEDGIGGLWRQVCLGGLGQAQHHE
ncbi:tectonin beta-propeller repeat-containing protein 1-like isoform X2 [Liolophura sinensis]|uniref:tectonin beta-propeller repeat-containing protein 1-like isoform X2 n=1 Tax=Liolophura sinensis TaxID=3198878 RepID=UPI0031598613